MSKIPTVEELRRDRQAITKEKFFTIAKHYGFSPRNGGNHVRVTHTTYPDIQFSPSFHSNRAHLTPLRLADAIERVQQKEAAITKKFQLAASEKSTARLSNIKNKLPDHIEAFYDDKKQIILRDAETPQIGLTLHCVGEDCQLTTKIEQLGILKREFYADIGRAHTQYDVQVTKQDDGTYSISHNIYNNLENIALPPYPDSEEPLTALMAYIDEVELIDIDHQIRLDTIKEQSNNHHVTASQPRGDRNNVVELRPNYTLSFKTSSNQRIAGDGSRARISEHSLLTLEQTISSLKEPRSSHKPLQLA